MTDPTPTGKTSAAGACTTDRNDSTFTPTPRRVCAVESGGDWADASVEYFTLPAEARPLDELRKEYERAGRYHGTGVFFVGWLKANHDAKEAGEEDIEIAWD